MCESLQKFKRKSGFRAAALLLCSAAVIAVAAPPRDAYASCGCTGAADAAVTPPQIPPIFAQMEANIKLQIDSLFQTYLGFSSGNPNGSHLQFITNDLYNARIQPALQNFTKQMSAIAMQQVAIIGTFFDAKQQLETQRLYQELQVQAHKDYQPSRDFCTFGTNVRSLAASEEVAAFNSRALNDMQMKRLLGRKSSASARDDNTDKNIRWQAFTDTYCDIHDNGWDPSKPDLTGLAPLCNTENASAADTKRQNIDINYTRLIDNPRTLDVAFYDENLKSTETDIFALSNNLFGHDVLSRGLGSTALSDLANQKTYMELRSVAAKRNVAQNSFNAIVGLKSNGSLGAGSQATNTREFLGAILKELGVTDNNDIYDLIGEDPSYYAQLEILAKKLYQSPDFFAGLYDKPANVERKSVAMKAIDLMLDRALYESQLRQEMAMSVLLSSKLQPKLETVSSQLGGGRD